MAVRKIKSKINTWKPKKYQIIIERDGKLFVCHFDRVFGFQDNLRPYNRFLIGKESYINQLDTIVNYTNFFINNYDEDNELVMGYLKTKFALDKEKIFNLESIQSYIDFIYEVIFTNTMVQKIIKMVNENYLDDIEVQGDDRKKYIKNEKKHLESLEFTNQHIKILLQISFGMKIMSPCIFHFIQLNNIKIEKDSDIIFRFYQKLFELFGYGETYCLYNENREVLQDNITQEEMDEIIFAKGLIPKNVKTDTRYYFTDESGKELHYGKTEVNMYNKLYVYVKAKVLESYANNSTIFSQREIFGTDVYTVVNQFTKKVLISENMVKYKFNENYDEKQHKFKENVIGFNKTINFMVAK